MRKSNVAMQNGGEGIKSYKGANQDQNGLSGSGFRRDSRGGMSTEYMLNPLLVPVKYDNHGDAGTYNEYRK